MRIAYRPTSKIRGMPRQHVGWHVPNRGIFCACTLALCEPHKCAFAPDFSRGYAGRQISQPVKSYPPMEVEEIPDAASSPASPCAHGRVRVTHAKQHLANLRRKHLRRRLRNDLSVCRHGRLFCHELCGCCCHTPILTADFRGAKSTHIPHGKSQCFKEKECFL